MSIKDDKRYQQLKVAPGVFIPDMGIDYPQEDPYTRMMPAPVIREVTFDENYPYLNKTFKFKIARFIAYLEVFTIFFLINKIRYGVRFKGRKVLWKYRKEFRKGIISVSNHCYRWDGMSISEALLHTLWIPMLSDHFKGPSWWYLTHFGGIPLSDGSFSATKKFNEAFDTHHAEGGWIHIFPEARSWLFYKPVRPWKKGAFTMAYKYNCPVLPINISYRPRTGIHRFFDNPEIPLVTVNIGEPIFPDKTQPRKTEVERLLNEAHTAVCRLGGIIENSWPATWDENESSNI